MQSYVSQLFLNTQFPSVISPIHFSTLALSPLFALSVIASFHSSASGGAGAIILKDAITRAPCLRLPSAMRAAAGNLPTSPPFFLPLIYMYPSEPLVLKKTYV